MDIEERMRDAVVAAEPGTLKRGQAIDSEDEMGMSAAALTSAGWVYVYDTVTGERSVCNKNMLARQLQKVRKDGTFIFTTTPPKKAPRRGTLKCLLHPDGENREHYDALGFPTCRKANLTSPFQVSRHMQKRHKMEWAAIEAERQAAEKQAEREFQERILSMAAGAKDVPEAPLYVSDKRGPGRPKKA